MMIIESFLQGKYIDAFRCEDALFISDDGVAVIDGATAKAHTVRHQTTPGKMAAQRIKAALHDCIGSADPFALLRTLNNAVAQLPFDPPPITSHRIRHHLPTAFFTYRELWRLSMHHRSCQASS